MGPIEFTVLGRDQRAPSHESMVKVSLSPLFRRKYPSITDVADNMFRRKAETNLSDEEL